MRTWNSLLCPDAYSWNVVRVLHQQDRIGPDDVIRIELQRMKAGIDLAPVETTIALLLRDESWRVRELIGDEGPLDQ